MGRSILGQVLVGAALVTGAAQASAAPPDPCAKVDESRRDDKLAACYEHTGRTASAWSIYLEIAAAEHDAGHAARERTARAKATAMEPKLVRLTLAVPRPVPGIEVRRDGVVVAPSQWNTGVPVDPGQHVISAAAPGRIPFSNPVMVVTTDVTLPVPELVPVPLPPPPMYAAPLPYEVRAPQKRPRYSTGMMAGGIVMVVVGPLTMLTAAFASADWSGGGHSSLGPGGTAAMIAGGLITLGGIPLIAVGARRVDPESASASRLRLGVGPGSVGLSGVF